MTRMKIGTALLALTLAMGGTAATAQEYNSLRASADQLMNEYGFDVDPGLLSDQQLTELQRLEGEVAEMSRAEAQTRIGGVLMSDEMTSTYETDPAGEAAWSSLRASADQLLNQYDFDISAELLSDQQLAEFRRLDSDLEGLSQADARTRIEGVLMDDAVTAAFVSDPGGEAAWNSLRASADQLLNQYGFEVDPELLSDQQLAEFRRLDRDLEGLSQAGARTRIEGVLMENDATAEFGTN